MHSLVLAKTLHPRLDCVEKVSVLSFSSISGIYLPLIYLLLRVAAAAIDDESFVVGAFRAAAGVVVTEETEST